MTPVEVLSPRLCALADELVPWVADLLGAIPRPPVNPLEVVCAIRLLMGSIPPGAIGPPEFDDEDHTTLLRVIALAALALGAGGGRNADDIDPDTDQPERIA
jgi:hypothetical protein